MLTSPLTVRSWPAPLAQRLRGPGLRLQTGPFVACVRSPLPALPTASACCMPTIRVLDDDALADFDLLLTRPARAAPLVPPAGPFPLRRHGAVPARCRWPRPSRCSNGR